MDNGANKSGELEQQVVELQDRLPKAIAVLDRLFEVQEQFESLVQQVNVLKAKNDTLERINRVQKTFDQRLAKLEEDAKESGLEEFSWELLKEIQSELSQIKIQLDQSNRKQVQLDSRVSELEKQVGQYNQERIVIIEQLKQFHQEGLDQIQKAFNQRLAALENINESRWNKFYEERNESQIIRQYKVLQTLKQGEMGNIYLACQKMEVSAKPTQLFVLKEMDADLSAIHQYEDRIEQTAGFLKALNHPILPKFFDFFVESGKKYLVMAKLDGQNLEDHINQQGLVPLKQAIQWMLQACNALTYLHKQDSPLIHGNIQPANLLMCSDDSHRVFVLDLRVVKEIGMPLGVQIGSKGYSAPEQEQGKLLPQSDLYAIGSTLIFLLTGENPQKFYNLRGQSYRFNLEGVDTIPFPLGAVIERVTNPDVRERYQTAQELAQALSPFFKV